MNLRLNCVNRISIRRFCHMCTWTHCAHQIHVILRRMQWCISYKQFINKVHLHDKSHVFSLMPNIIILFVVLSLFWECLSYCILYTHIIVERTTINILCTLCVVFCLKIIWHTHTHILMMANWFYMQLVFR